MDEGLKRMNGSLSNPIYQRERIRQQRLQSRYARHWRTLGLLVFFGMIVGAALSLFDLNAPSRELAIFAVWTIHAFTIVRCIIIGVNVIAGEHEQQTWDGLVMTGASAATIWWGKWLAALNAAAPWLLTLGAMRLLMLPISAIGVMKEYGICLVGQNFGYYGANCFGVYSNDTATITWVPWAAGLAVLSTITLSALEIFASTSLGLAMGMFIKRKAPALVLALILRFIPVVLGVLLVLQSENVRYMVANGMSIPFRTIFTFSETALADMGTASISRLVLPLFAWTISSNTHENAKNGLLLAYIGLFTTFVICAALSYLAIRSSGALTGKRPS